MIQPKATRREVLAFLALADAPAPDQIRFDYSRPGTLTVEVGSFAAADAWRTAFAVEFWDGGPTTITQDGSAPYRTVTHYAEQWRGWRVQIEADERLALDEPLDDATAAQLREIATEEASS
jgi:hypothetical protein